MPKLCPNITFPHQQDFFPIRSVTKFSTARFSHENLVEKFKIFVQDFVPIRTALREQISGIWQCFVARHPRVSLSVLTAYLLLYLALKKFIYGLSSR